MEIEKENKRKKTRLGSTPCFWPILPFPPLGPSRPVDPPPPRSPFLRRDSGFWARSSSVALARAGASLGDCGVGPRQQPPPLCAGHGSRGIDWRAPRVIFLSRTRRLQWTTESAGASPPRVAFCSGGSGEDSI
jgi:hypothetical protein